MVLAGYLTLAFLISIVEFNRKKPLPFDFVFMFNLWFAGCYAIIPLLILLFESDIRKYYHVMGYTFLFGNWYTPWLLIVAYILFLCGYYSGTNTRFSKKIYVKNRISEGSLLFCIMISTASLLLMVIVYCISNGGLTATIAKGVLTRLTGAEAEIGRFAFLARIFVPLLPILLYYTFYKSIIQKDERRSIYRFLFVIVFGVFFVIAAIKAGRGFIIFTLLGLYFLYCNYKRKIFKAPLLLMGILLLVFVLFGKPLLGTIPYIVTGQFGEIESFLDVKQQVIDDRGMLVEFVRNATHPINSLQISLSYVDAYKYRYFEDFLSAAIRMIPTALFGISDIPFSTVSFVNTKIITSSAEGGIPPGLLGGLVYMLYIPGLLLGCYFYGVLGRSIQNITRNSLRISNTTLVPHYLLIFSFGFFIFNGDIAVFIPKNIILLMFFLIILLTSRIFIVHHKPTGIRKNLGTPLKKRMLFHYENCRD